MLIETLEKMETGLLQPEKQDDSQAGEYARTLDKAMGKIDFSMPAIQIERLIRGLNPWPSAYTSYQGKTMKIWKAEVTKGTDANVGEIISVDKQSFTVQTKEGALRILELQMEGKKRMDAGAFLRGCEVTLGQMLGESI